MPVFNLLVLITMVLRHWKLISIIKGCIFFLGCYVLISGFLRIVRETEIEIFTYFPRTQCMVKKKRALAEGLEACVWILALYLTCYVWTWASSLTFLGLHMFHCRVDQITASQQEQKSPLVEVLAVWWLGGSQPRMTAILQWTHRTVLNNEITPQVPQISHNNFL